MLGLPWIFDPARFFGDQQQTDPTSGATSDPATQEQQRQTPGATAPGSSTSNAPAGANTSPGANTQEIPAPPGAPANLP